MNTAKVTCDACEKDITTTGATPTYRLRLSAEALPFTEDYRHAILVYPPIKHDHHFCSKKCLADWATKQISK